MRVWAPRASVWLPEEAAHRVMTVHRDGLVGRPDSRRHIICGAVIRARTGDRVYKKCTYNQRN